MENGYAQETCMESQVQQAYQMGADSEAIQTKGGNRMSGIYIPNMVNPVRCSECDFCTYGYCGLLDRYVTDSAYKDDACPLVPVPDHGRPNGADQMAANNVYDQREVHENVTVEIWSNSETGETRIGWRKP